MGTVVGKWRLKLLLLLLILLTITYTVNGMFIEVQDSLDTEGYYYPDYKDIEYNDTASATDSGDDFISVLTQLGEFLTFQNIDNAYAMLFLNMFTSVCFISIGYIVFTFIKEFIPFV